MAPMKSTLRPLALALLAALCAPAWPQTTQEHVHSHAHAVMPFDVAKTVHIFRMTESGGVQRVVTRISDVQQADLVRQHLKQEALQFQHGNYADPARLHGAGMPGLAQLREGAARIKVTYRELPNGAELEFRTRDISLVTAIHRWFGAQLSEHGADAKAE